MLGLGNGGLLWLVGQKVSLCFSNQLSGLCFGRCFLKVLEHFLGQGLVFFPLLALVLQITREIRVLALQVSQSHQQIFDLSVEVSILLVGRHVGFNAHLLAVLVC